MKYFKIIIPVFLSGILLMISQSAEAQEIAENAYWVYFTDKDNNGYDYTQPLGFLSQRSVDRRAWQGLGLDLSDEPVTPAYVDSLLSLEYEVRHVSRWLNGALVVNTAHYRFLELLELGFVDTIPWSSPEDGIYFPPKPAGQRFGDALGTNPEFDYGLSENQIDMLSLKTLHSDGYTGKGVWIGLLDGGFSNVDSLPSFEAMIEDGRLLGTRNFVNDTSVFRLVNRHGMYVLSIVGGLWDGNIMGTAPHASYFLCSTENIWEETRIEEIAWIEGAEFLDSLGIDVFNTSLGYSEFDGGMYDYSYADMDGSTTFISRAASMCASKGIILSNSAGNSGNDSWYYVTAPADAFDILSVAAVDSSGIIASFSSRGPSYDGRLTPNVAAQGVLTALQHWNGGMGRGGGTSFSSPLIAGATACLWQAYPEMPARELIDQIRLSADRAMNPDATYGYGIPNYQLAYWPASDEPYSLIHRENGSSMVIYPNPASDVLNVSLDNLEGKAVELSIFDMAGRMVDRQETQLPARLELPENLKPGLYIIEARTAGRSYHSRFIQR